MPERREPYPPIEPYDHGFLPVGDDQQVYWEVSGNPDGKPVVFLHGGPGGGTSPQQRRFFDPEAYRIVMFDQRGCGRSRPHVADGADLSVNTTDHLLADIEQLRVFLNIERWMVFGGSWGSTLALAYAQRHRDRVSELVLRGIFLLRRSEIDWYYNGGAGAVFPDLWEGFLAPLAGADPGEHPVDTYHRLLHSPDPDVALRAAVAWSTWEAELVRCYRSPTTSPTPRSPGSHSPSRGSRTTISTIAVSSTKGSCCGMHISCMAFRA